MTNASASKLCVKGLGSWQWEDKNTRFEGEELWNSLH